MHYTFKVSSKFLRLWMQFASFKIIKYILYNGGMGVFPILRISYLN